VEADEPLTAEDIAAGVKAVNAFKQDKAKVKIHCGVVDIEDAARDVEAAPKSVDPKAEKALDAKVKKVYQPVGRRFQRRLLCAGRTAGKFHRCGD
jgi:hypothetical protein